jgi:aspartate racemase
MPCNAAHAHAAAIRKATPLPFFSIIDETADEVARTGARKAGVLAAGACLEARLYQDALTARGVEPIVPDRAAQDDFMALLYRIKAGDTGPDARSGMKALADALIGAGAEAVIAGCTEIPLVLGAADLSVPLIDSTDALARATIAAARSEAG